MEVCRACMSSSLSLVDIFSEQPLPHDQSSLADMVNKLDDFKVMRDDPFRQQMCESCCINAQIAFRFKIQFDQCSQLLSLQTEQVKLPLEIKIEVEPEDTTTRQNMQGILSPTTTSINCFESYLDVSHKLEYAEEQTFNCKVCPATFSLEIYLDQHKHKHTKKYKCKLCSALLPNKCNYQRHIKNHTGEWPFKCSHCDKGFMQKSVLKAHIRTHNGERPFKCSHCEKSFGQNYHLKVHSRIHTGEHPYKCEECSMTFSQLSNLKTHQFHHIEERPYSCDQCPKTFIQKYSLNTHMKGHTGEWPFKCSYCDKGFLHELSLTTHIRNHTGELPFKCEECLAKYCQWNNLDEKERKHKDKPIKMAFKSRRHLLKHIQAVHKVELDQMSCVPKALETV